MPFTITKGDTLTAINFESTNVFQLSFPVSLSTPLISQPPDSDLLTHKIIISDIIITNVFGGTIQFHHLATSTRLLDFINISHFLNVDLNRHSPPPLSTATTIAYLLLIGVAFASLSILSLFLVDNLFKLLCIGWLRLVKCQRTGVFQFAIINIIFVVTLLLSVTVCYVGLLHTDDGFFNLMAKYPQDVLSGLPSTYYTITHLFFVLVGGDIVLFRVLTVLLSILTVAVLCLVFFRVMTLVLKFECSNKSIYAIFVLLVIANSFQYLHHVTPDYNNLSRVIVYFQVTILLVIFYQPICYQLYWWCFVLGIITGVNLFIKAPEAIASSLVIVILLGLGGGKSYFKKLCCYALGLGSATLFYFSFIQSFHDWYSVLRNSIYYNNLLGGHQVKLLLFQNFHDIIYFIGQSLLIVVFYNWLIQPLVGKYSRQYVTALFLSVVLLITICVLFNIHRQPDLFKFFPPLGKAFLLIFLIILYENIRKYKVLNEAERIKFKHVNWICLILLVFTYIASVGTDTPIFYHVMFHPVLIVIAIILQWWLFDNNNNSRMLILFILIFTCGLIFVKGIVYNSAMYINLLQQTVRYNIAGERVYISPGADSGLNQLKVLLKRCGYQDGNYIAGYYTMPDLIFALGGRSPVTPWYSDSSDNSNTLKANQYIDSLTHEMVSKKLFILVDTSKNMTSVGVDFQHDVVSCGSVNFESLNDFKIKHIAIFRQD